MKMSYNWLIIEGAKQNNLKNISLKLPHNKVIAVTGISGSGKSSLAFDTIFAEGQWRFIESLSTYARLFIEKLDRPDVDSIKNIRPAIALQQHNPVRGARSTVGTITEIYDLLRILFARVATQFCPECGTEILRWNPSSVVREMVKKYEGEKAVIVFLSSISADELKMKGFHRVFIDGKIVDITEIKKDIRTYPVVADRFVIKDSKRLSDSIESAWRHGNDSVRVIIPPSGELIFSAGNTCDRCGHDISEPSPVLFSFNHPLGACPECNGFGNILRYSRDLVIPDTDMSIADGAVEPWEKPAAHWLKEQIIENAPKSGIDIHRPFHMLPDDQKEMVFQGTEHFYGIDDFFEELEHKRYKIHVRVFLSRYRSTITCPRCKGKRLKKEALSYRIADRDIADISGMKIGDLLTFFEHIGLSEHQTSIAKEVLEQINFKIRYLNRVGLDYLSLDRPSRTLSGGEYQRINLSNQLASHLTGTLYVLDEPTVGLHAKDTETISSIMEEISRLGNTIIVVEHDRNIINTSGWVVELGPGGGRNGGNIVFSGPIESFLKQDTLTAQYIKGDKKISIPPGRRSRKRQYIFLEGASGHNLKDIDLKIPLQTQTVVTGVSGSGKSSLLIDTLYNAIARKLKKSAETPLAYRSISGQEHIKDIKLIDQSPIGRSPRSNPATYLKLFDSVRKIFAGLPGSKAKGYTPGFFSFNVPGGRCEECAGEGFQKIEMYFFEDVFVKCHACNGSRYSSEALGITYRGKTISDILNMTMEEASIFFSDIRNLSGHISLLLEIGLGYLLLGQPATTLSGGEAQRLRICAEFSSRTKNDTLYILDEPTIGLHLHDVAKLINIIRQLVDRGNTVVVIEHNPDFIKTADWIVDIGPGGGDRGGKIVFEGTPRTIINSKTSITGRYLRKSETERYKG
ncbi:UvrABC system protein A [bacterium BMS3Abin07]|nr:UvrABC system protein A [bacterium BMS3Abin07]GBE31235.1 UvrABC system protein A [bacterium BMS3Bbin05]HDL20036.1 excinuclease ABC subunit A [Nitrospirota bacterium]HDO23512.1 excinuclease ABC subunit A [Nitrospirota bacterium]HDZ87536.1 excinuclease ABC subunit A [Nitrospirota bacterium]